MKFLILASLMLLSFSRVMAYDFLSLEDENKTVFERDDRTSMLDSKLPFSAIGKIYYKNADNQTFSCTGTLVGPDLVLTNSHCVRDLKTGELFKDLVFYPNFKDGNWKYFSYASHAMATDRNIDVRRDIAFIRLTSPLGLKTGYLEFENVNTMTSQSEFDRVANSNIMLAGYSGDFQSGRTAGVHRGCSIHAVVGNNYLHDCDSTGGSSGSALISMISGKIVGLHFAASLQSNGTLPPSGVPYSDALANIAVSLPEVLKYYEQAQQSLKARTETEITICNKIKGKWATGNLNSAIAYPVNGTLESHGWFILKNNSCREFLINTAATKFYVYAWIGNSQSTKKWKAGLFHAGKRLCIDKVNAFHYSNPMECDGENRTAVKFKAFDIGHDKINWVDIQ